MDVLFPILFILVIASVLVFLIVAVRSFLTSKDQKPSDIDVERSGAESSGLGTSDYSTSGDSDTASPGDAFGGGGDFGGGGSGGSFPGPEIGESLNDPDAGAGGDDFGDGGGDGGGDSGDSGGDSGNGGSGE